MTTQETVYLKPNVVFEPLVDRWYAWSHLLSPATAALNITGRHLKIINSYIQAPQIHAAACKNPKMLGGPFMDLQGKRVDDVKALRERTMSEQADLIELSEALQELNSTLQSKAKGYSLNELYDEVPEALRGFVELTYDLNNNANFRLFEALLYHSKYYRPESQSIAMWITENDERPFVLSTPRLEEEDILHFQIPFKDSAIDKIAAMKRNGGKLEDVIPLLPEMSEKELDLFKSFFTTEAPPAYEPYTGDKIRMRYFGHACILVETKDVSILVDPLISYYGYESSVDHFSDADLPDKIDYVLITHNHQDHILFETLLPLRHKIGKIVVPRSGYGSLQDPDLKLMFNNIGFDNIVEIGDLEEVKFEDITITGVPFLGEHADLDIRSKVCHHVKAGKFSMLFVADSCNVAKEVYEKVHDILGDTDVIFLGMECDGAPLSWLYGPLMPQELSRDRDGSRRLAGSNYERGKNLVDKFNPKEVYVYAMGQEPWCEFISSIKYTAESHPIVQSDMLVKDCGDRGIVAERLFGEKELLYNKFPESVEA
ncbi:MBL fold metallo-hydrolase [Roseivirga sp. BDSF3-8]|uniref:MBL fold metallo-hydrolase n=1 Tax=Roseivirga sp. BDSF3-8 TaxID=3241598 RepID=UPI0035320001